MVGGGGLSAGGIHRHSESGVELRTMTNRLLSYLFVLIQNKAENWP